MIAVLSSFRVPVKRAILFHVKGTSENCPQHIPIRYSEKEVAAMMAPLRDRIAELEQS
jgi:uncharacterized protein